MKTSGRRHNFFETVLTSGGTAYIELILVLPVVLALAFSSIELSRILRFQQILSSVSREGANATFRDCAHLPDGGAIRQCLNDTVYPVVVEQYAHDSLPGSEVILSVFLYDAGSDTVALKAQAGIIENTGVTQGMHRSRFTAALDSQNPRWPDDLYREVPRSDFPLSSIGPTNPVVVVSEVFYDYSPIVLNTLPYQTDFRLRFYEPTIF